MMIECVRDPEVLGNVSMMIGLVRDPEIQDNVNMTIEWVSDLKYSITSA